MTPHALWTLILKISGLYFLFQFITLIPQAIVSVIITMQPYNGESSVAILLLLSTVAFYIGIIWIFLFKSDWIIRKFQLVSYFREESSIIQISIIFIGANIIVDSIPQFCSRVFSFYQSKSIFRENTDSKWLILNFVKIITGYLMISYNRQLTSAFERKRRSSKEPVE